MTNPPSSFGDMIREQNACQNIYLDDITVPIMFELVRHQLPRKFGTSKLSPYVVTLCCIF